MTTLRLGSRRTQAPRRFGGGLFSTTMGSYAWTAWWRLGESSGTSAADATGNGHALIYYNNPSLGQTGLVANDSDTSVRTSATAPSWVYQETATWMNASTFTVFIRFIADDVAEERGIFNRYDSTLSTGVWALRTKTSHAEFVIFDGSGGSTVLDAGPIAPATAYTLGGTFDGTTARVYLNGVLAASHAATLNGSPSMRLNIGRESSPSNDGAGLSGVVDEAAFGGGLVLTDAQMAELHSLAAG